jgi:hypothetical protein
MTAPSEQEFRIKSVEALEDARRALSPFADEAAFEIELQNGVMNLEFEEPIEAKFVVSPMSRSYKLSWAPELGAFALDGETLTALLERLARLFLDGSA